MASELEKHLCDFVTHNILALDPRGPTTYVDTEHWRFNLPTALYPLLNADYLPRLAEEFSRISHEGEPSEALSYGRTLLALYAILYPLNYPQTGMSLTTCGSEIAANLKCLHCLSKVCML